MPVVVCLAILINMQDLYSTKNLALKFQENITVVQIKTWYWGGPCSCELAIQRTMALPFFPLALSHRRTWLVFPGLKAPHIEWYCPLHAETHNTVVIHPAASLKADSASLKAKQAAAAPSSAHSCTQHWRIWDRRRNPFFRRGATWCVGVLWPFCPWWQVISLLPLMIDLGFFFLFSIATQLCVRTKYSKMFPSLSALPMVYWTALAIYFCQPWPRMTNPLTQDIIILS